MNPMDDLFAISSRVRGKASSAVLDKALIELDAKTAAMASRLAGLEEKLKTGILELDSKQFAELEHEKRVFTAALEQAETLKAGIRERKAQAEETEAAAPLRTSRSKLEAKQANFAERWSAFYAVVLPQFGDLLDELKALEAERAQLNGQMRMHAMRFKRPIINQPADLQEMTLPPISAGYMERLCLPEAGIPPTRGYAIPMAHKGEWWTGRQEETPPEFLVKLQEDMRARDARDKADRERREREEAAGGSRYQDLNPATHRRLGAPYDLESVDDIAENQALANEFHGRDVAKTRICRSDAHDMI